MELRVNCLISGRRFDREYFISRPYILHPLASIGMNLPVWYPGKHPDILFMIWSSSNIPESPCEFRLIPIIPSIQNAVAGAAYRYPRSGYSGWAWAPVDRLPVSLEIPWYLATFVDCPFFIFQLNSVKMLTQIQRFLQQHNGQSVLSLSSEVPREAAGTWSWNPPQGYQAVEYNWYMIISTCRLHDRWELFWW